MAASGKRVNGSLVLDAPAKLGPRYSALAGFAENPVQGSHLHPPMGETANEFEPS